jgi:hypothetical protein
MLISFRQLTFSFLQHTTEHLLEHKAEWLNTNEKEEDAVIEATLTAIWKAHSENEDSVPLAENMSEVLNYISC